MKGSGGERTEGTERTQKIGQGGMETLRSWGVARWGHRPQRGVNTVVGLWTLYIRGRNGPYGPPPAQIPASGITAPGSYLESNVFIRIEG